MQMYIQKSSDRIRHTRYLLKHTALLFFVKNANHGKILESRQLVFLCKSPVIFNVLIDLLILHI